MWTHLSLHWLLRARGPIGVDIDPYGLQECPQWMVRADMHQDGNSIQARLRVQDQNIFIRKEGFKLMGASPPAAICLGSSFSIICQIGFFARLPDWFFRQIARLEVDGGSRQISQIGWIDRLARLDLLPD